MLRPPGPGELCQARKIVMMMMINKMPVIVIGGQCLDRGIDGGLAQL